MQNFENLALLLVALFAPLCGCVFAALFSASKPKLALGVINSLFVGLSFVASAILLYQVCGLAQFADSHLAESSLVDSYTLVNISLFEWLVLGNFGVDFSFSLDRISAVMIFAISLVSMLVHIYSIGYMKDDKGFNRYFSFLSGFVFSMMFLVLSDNFLGLFVGWEGVGVCSYLLIGFWYQKASANFASIEAFISNRIADLGMLLGIFLIFYAFGSLEYEVVFGSIDESEISQKILLFVGILLFIGAMGKSAQFPFHTWLANAMEGPTPVSALIHAATMVTAGVYLVIRANPLYSEIPHFGEIIAYLGTFVAIFAASMAVVNNDLKRIIAYSTLSQLGYMFVAAGLGAYSIALFHLFTHAFFKSLLFLCAGNVMHAMHDELNIKKMGNLARPLKYTMIFMLIGNLALCGIPPFAGYFSKDLILEFSFSAEYKILWILLVFGAFLTAFYSFRLFMLVFFCKGSSCDLAHDSSHNSHLDNHSTPHEASLLMLLSMLPLAILAIIAGFFNTSFFALLSQAIPFEMPHGDLSEEILALITLGVSACGIIFAILRYAKKSSKTSQNTTQESTHKKPNNLLYDLLSNQYYIPKIYEWIFVKGFSKLCDFVACKIEQGIMLKIISLLERFLVFLSKILSLLQNGSLSSSLRLMSFGVLLLLCSVVFLFIGGR